MCTFEIPQLIENTAQWYFSSLPSPRQAESAYAGIKSSSLGPGKLVSPKVLFKSPMAVAASAR